MEQIMIISCQLEVPPEIAPQLDATLEAFADACNYIDQTVPENMSNNVRIQSLVYQDIRQKFGLSANLAVRAINRVATTRKIAKQKGNLCKEFQPTTVDYDTRIFSWRERDCTVSLTLVGGRERFKLSANNSQLQLLQGGIPTSATLTKQDDGAYYIQIKLTSKPPQATA